MSELPDWEGVPGAPEHRTVGSHRAWCLNDSEWCYPDDDDMCPCCQGTLGREALWIDPKEARLRRFAMNDKIWIDEAWQLPDDLADQVRQGNYADAWKLEIERTAQMRAVLEDLIAGVQIAVDDYGERMHGSARAYLLGIRDGAEARLKEVTGDE